MMNVKETLKRLHKRLPTLSLDELFELLDCYVEYVEYDSNTIDWLNYKKPSIWEPNKVWYSTDKITCSEKGSDIYTVATNKSADGKIAYYNGGGSTQLVAEH